MQGHWLETDLNKICIVGFATKLPGSDCSESYWENLKAGDSLTYQIREWGDSLRATGGFLNNIKSFDPDFFNISEAEAICMDPQQRLLLETSWHAIESSGISLEKLIHLRTGIFASSLPSDYKNLLVTHKKESVSTHSFLGNAPSALSGRLSYFYNFNGPSITIDTACSSGLTTLNIAKLSLQNNECEAALVGAVSIFSTSEFYQLASHANMISPNHRCAVFDEKADGFVPAEGVVVLVLMSLSKAIELKAHVYGVIDSLCINHDGLSNGLMAPNSRAQAAVIQKAHQQSQITFNDIAMVETHGTGTQLGDLIELRGLTTTAEQEQFTKTCYLGASKTVIGHTLVCSGLAGIVKVLLSYQHQLIPPNKLFNNKNRLAEIAPFIINQKAVTWPTEKIFAGISSFGFTGSNAHLIMKFPKKYYENLPPKSHSLYAFSKKDYWIETEKLNGNFNENYLATLGLRVENSATSMKWIVSKQKGESVILLPPLNTNFLAWMRQISFLHAKGFQLHIPHYPGHEPSSFEENFSFEMIIHQIANYCLNYNLNAHFVGWSLGGVLSILTALRFPNLVKSLTLISSAAQFDSELFGKTIEMQNELHHHQELLAIVFQTQNQIGKHISANSNMNILHQYYQALIALNISSIDLEKILAPTLILYGLHDPVSNKIQSDFLSKIPYSNVKSYPNAGHFIPLTQASIFNTDLYNHIKTIEPINVNA